MTILNSLSFDSFFFISSNIYFATTLLDEINVIDCSWSFGALIKDFHKNGLLLVTNLKVLKVNGSVCGISGKYLNDSLVLTVKDSWVEDSFCSNDVFYIEGNGDTKVYFGNVSVFNTSTEANFFNAVRVKVVVKDVSFYKIEKGFIVFLMKSEMSVENGSFVDIQNEVLFMIESKMICDSCRFDVLYSTAIKCYQSSSFTIQNSNFTNCNSNFGS